MVSKWCGLKEGDRRNSGFILAARSIRVAPNLSDCMMSIYDVHT